MKKKKYILLAVALLLIVITAGIGAHFYPRWKSAETLQNNLDFAHYSCELEAELDRKELSESQNNFIEILAKLMGLQEGDLYRLTVKENAWEDKLHILIYPKGTSEPLIELYSNGDATVVNETILYNAFRTRVVSQYPLLSYLMPEQEEDLYMTLEQVEQIFGIDLSAIHDFPLSFSDREFTAKHWFAMLASMSRKKQEDGNLFELVTEQVQVRFHISAGEDTSAVTIQFSVRDIKDTFADKKDLFSRIGMQMSDEQIRILKSFDMTLMSGEGKEFVMPTNLVNQSTVDLISEIRAKIGEVIEGLSD